MPPRTVDASERSTRFTGFWPRGLPGHAPVGQALSMLAGVPGRSTIGSLMLSAARRVPPGVRERIEGLGHRNLMARRAIRFVSAPVRTGAHQIQEGPAAGLSMDVKGSRPTYLLGTAE